MYLPPQLFWHSAMAAIQARAKSKSGAVVKHQRAFVVLKTISNVKWFFKSSTAPLYSSLVTYMYMHTFSDWEGRGGVGVDGLSHFNLNAIICIPTWRNITGLLVVHDVVIKWPRYYSKRTTLL